MQLDKPLIKIEELLSNSLLFTNKSPDYLTSPFANHKFVFLAKFLLPKVVFSLVLMHITSKDVTKISKAHCRTLVESERHKPWLEKMNPFLDYFSEY